MVIKFNYTGKVALITGSSSGIGMETAILLSKLGASLVITGRNAIRLSEISEKCRILSPTEEKPLSIVGDVTNDNFLKELIEKTIEKFQKIDILINNAGVMKSTNLFNQSIDIFDELMAVDLRPIVLLTHLSLPYLVKSKGVIVNVSSVAGVKPLIEFSDYCALKSAINMYTQVVALELASKGVRCLSVNPGGVETPLLKNVINPTEDKSAVELLSSKHPTGRLALPQEIANLIVYLASDNAANITGSNFISDGAFSLQGVLLNDSNINYAKDLSSLKI